MQNAKCKSVNFTLLQGFECGAADFKLWTDVQNLKRKSDVGYSRPLIVGCDLATPQQGAGHRYLFLSVT